MDLEDKAAIISEVLKEWFDSESKTDTTPEEIIPHLISKGIYNENKRKNASSLRNDLRKLDEINELSLIEEAGYIQNDQNKIWHFKKR